MTDKQLQSEQMEARVIRELSRLPVFSPSRGFGDRVMARVRLPRPGLLVLMVRARAWALEPGRAMVLGGAYALSAVVALGVVVPWLVGNSPAIGFAADWASARAVGALRDSLLAVAGWTVSSGISGFLKSLSLTGARLWYAVGTLMVGYAACAAGLHFLLRAPRGNDARIPAAY